MAKQKAPLRRAMSHPAASGWAPRDAVAELYRRLSRFEAVLGVAFGELEDAAGRLTGEVGLIALVDTRLEDEVAEVRKLVTGRLGGYAIGVRPPLDLRGLPRVPRSTGDPGRSPLRLPARSVLAGRGEGPPHGRPPIGTARTERPRRPGHRRLR